MTIRLFPNSYAASYRGFDFELIKSGVSKHPALLDSMRDEVLAIAARSRGWDDEASMEALRRHFKIGPLYEANGLALVRKEGSLVGLAGSVNNWHVPEGSIVHLCSVGFMPEVQKRGIMPLLMGILWLLSLEDKELQQSYREQRVFISAITQSPYLVAYLGYLFDTYPSPRRAAPDPEMVRVAQHVVDRFDPELYFETDTFVLRNECKFFYKKLPLSPDPQVNELCDRNLRYDEGDVFVVIGRVDPVVIDPLIGHMTESCPELFEELRRQSKDSQ